MHPHTPTKEQDIHTPKTCFAINFYSYLFHSSPFFFFFLLLYFQKTLWQREIYFSFFITLKRRKYSQKKWRQSPPKTIHHFKTFFNKPLLFFKKVTKLDLRSHSSHSVTIFGTLSLEIFFFCLSNISHIVYFIIRTTNNRVLMEISQWLSTAKSS